MTVTIQGMAGTTCSHRVVQTDKGDYPIRLADITDAIPDSLTEVKEAVILIVKHQYLSRRAAGRTHAQALSDLLNFVVRL